MGRNSERALRGRTSADGCGRIGSSEVFCGDSPVSPAGLDDLMKTIEGEIIPRLVLAHRSQTVRRQAAGRSGCLSAGDVEQFAALLLDGDLDAPRAFVSGLQETDVPLESVYLELFSPAARRLGEMWSADLCDFTAVTLGLWRLQRLLYEFAPSFHVDAEMPVEGRRILLAPLPGDQHTFGLFMVAEFFRRAGWDVVDGPVVNATDIAAAVSRNWFEIVGLSLSCDRGLDAMAAMIREVRRASRNRGIGIIVGGPVFIEHPDAVLRVDADVSASDARQALEAAQNLLFAKPQRQRVAGSM
jgi:MerR family transcriptional regulator, light-induced transcriptional regulator